jgi:hypothetical protein
MDQGSFEKLIGSQKKNVSLCMKLADVLLFNRSTDYIHDIFGKSFISMIFVTPQKLFFKN